MIEIQGEPDLYNQGNDELIEAYIALMEGDFNFEDNYDICEELIHTIRTHVASRFRCINNKMLKQLIGSESI